MPAVFELGLPALRRTLLAGRSWDCGCTDAFFTLLAAVDDTTVYHRGGAAGAALVQAHGRRFIDAGGTAHPDWRRTALASHRAFVRLRLSPGGVADLLAATCLVQRATHHVPAPAASAMGAVQAPAGAADMALT